MFVFRWHGIIARIYELLYGFGYGYKYGYYRGSWCKIRIVYRKNFRIFRNERFSCLEPSPEPNIAKNVSGFHMQPFGAELEADLEAELEAERLQKTPTR